MGVNELLKVNLWITRTIYLNESLAPSPANLTLSLLSNSVANFTALRAGTAISKPSSPV